MARQKNQAARRAELLAAAAKAISEHGPGKVRVADIAEAAGVAKGSVHYYFKDLDDLLEQVYREAGERYFTQRLDEVTRHADARDKLIACIRMGLPDGPEDQLTGLLYRTGVELPYNPLRAALAEGLTDRQVGVYVGVLEVGRAQGHFRIAEPVQDVAANLVALEDTYASRIIYRRAPGMLDRAMALILGYARAVTGCPGLTPDRIPDPTEEDPAP
ncbi:TetR/AcrR family transcriptional regulator [Kitasatospora paranensis]|uniref:TetR/AcrR family transcriptional regulator n=1 Tax=Kitasatospora paranensis TaxID=258053 RepID=A0ABW2FXX2_9ACTN